MPTGLRATLIPASKQLMLTGYCLNRIGAACISNYRKYTLELASRSVSRIEKEPRGNIQNGILTLEPQIFTI